MNDGKGLEPDPLDLPWASRRQHATQLSLDREMIDGLPRLFGCPHRAGGASIETEGMIWMRVCENDGTWIDPTHVLAPSFPAIDHDVTPDIREQCGRVHPMAPIPRADVASSTEEDDFHRWPTDCSTTVRP